jgi:hypothetical protein
MTEKKSKLKPREETKKKMRPMTRDAFHRLIGKAISSPATKPAPKLT